MKHNIPQKNIILNPKDSLSDIIYHIKSYAFQNKNTSIYIPESMYVLYNPVNRELFANNIKHLSDKYDIDLYSTDNNLIYFLKSAEIKVKYLDNIQDIEEASLNQYDNAPYTDFLSYKQVIQDNTLQHSVQSEPIFQTSATANIKVNTKTHLNNNTKPVSKSLLYISIILGIIFTSLLSLIFIPKAEITIKTKSEELSKDFDVTFDPNITDVSLENRTIPSIVDTISASVDGTYEATGSQTGGTKAEGEITIINKTSLTQQLVSNTRFRSEKGKQFRLTESVIVPENSSINANIIAESVGTDYNIPAGKLTIPGLEDTPTKFASIYGELKVDLKNGATEDGTVTTNEDIDKARIDLQKKLTEVVNTQITAKEGFDDLAIQSKLNDIKYEGLPNAGEGVRSFNVKANSSLDGVFYKKEDLDKIIKSLLETQVLESQELGEINIRFDRQQEFPNRQAVKVRVYVDYKIQTKFDKDEIANNIRLKTTGQSRAYLENLDNVDTLDLNLTPSFSPILPALKSRININIQ
ncbi:MAG: baseplate J/gp47 family protein [Candidatus Paceibacterota bacterium]